MSRRHGQRQRPEVRHRPLATLGRRPIPTIEADFYQSRRPTEGPLAVFFHASNGFRHDLTQLAWATASLGVDALNVSWISGPVRRGHPDAYAEVAQLFRVVARSHDSKPRPLVLVTWCDSSLVVLTELARWTGAEPGIAPQAIAITIAGVFGWPDEPPDEILASDRALAFFGGDPSRSAGWTEDTPHATASLLRSPLQLISVTSNRMLEKTRRYHEATREAGMATRLLTWAGSEAEFISPRLPAGRAVSELIADAAARLEQDCEAG